MPDPAPFPHIKTPWDSAKPAADQAGEQPPAPIPDHTLIRRIGKGSYGEVWLARSALGVYRAVKIVHRRSFDDDRPFERELAGIQRFEPVSRTHESQLNILHVGRGLDCFYYVMELADDASGDGRLEKADGEKRSCPTSSSDLPSSISHLPSPDTYTPRTLRSELLFRGRLPIDECLHLGLALTTALEHLHRHGLVHRDIKPSNIVFVNGIPKLADIGLVARAEGTKSFVGTEGYLPPEGPGTKQADLFSLGKVLYELSTGRDRQQFPELPTNVTELPDRAELAEFNEVLIRACAPDVRHRYESAAEMHADLALLQSGKSV
ncbi:MAG TPA: serine/threonine-protein kinase, partial [Candidatus Eisenbacteria bacterium]|nr:serine/threonine-protein kinase [Candidatus Eisenbacteria bacterium]